MNIKSKPQPFFRAALKNDTLELSIYEEIGENFWTGGGVTAASVKKQLDAAQYDRITLRINSPGGDAFEGVAIYTLLRSLGKPVNCYVDGIAASAASIIAMAGDTITMGIGAMMMIHDAWSVCAGNDEDMRKMADTLEKVSNSIAKVYVSRTGKSMDEVAALMDAETWMSADDCVKNGFATAIANDDDEEAMALAASFKSLARLKNVPETLQPKNEAEAEEQPEAKPEESEVVEIPEEAEVVEDSNLSQFEARLKMLRAA